MSILRVAAACGAVFYGGWVVPAMAQKASAPGPMEHVLVSVPIHRTEAETALPITLVTGEALHEVVASSIGETLAHSPGIANASFGPGVGQPVIRGQQGARVMVLQNSTGSGDVAASSGDHAVAVEPILAQSVEVMRGPATLLYGGGAIGGVVNVIDSRIPVTLPEAFGGQFELRHASVNDETTGVLRLQGGAESLALYLDAVMRDSNDLDIPGRAVLDPLEESSDGYIANTDSEAQQYTLGTSYLFDNGYVGVAVSQRDSEYGIPGAAHNHDPLHPEEVVRIDLEKTRVDLRGDLHREQGALETLRWFVTHSDYEHQELEGDEVGTRWRNDSWEGRLEMLHRPLAGWHGVVGLQLTTFELSAEGDESFIPETTVDRFGLFVVEDHHWRDWLFELGARWDREQLKPTGGAGDSSYDNISLAASTLWQFRDHWSLGLALSQSGRAPVIEELYSNQGNAPGSYVEHVASGAIEIGSEDLDSELSRNADLTLNYRGERSEGFLTVFYNDFSDFIYLDNTGLVQGGTDILAWRQADAEFTGIEFEWQRQLGRWWRGDVELRLFGDFVQGQLDSGVDLPRLPPHRVGARLGWRGESVGTFIVVTDAGKQDHPGSNEAPTDGYTRWDAGVDYRLDRGGDGELLLFLRVNNLSDEEIRLSTSFLREVAPEPGRSLETGVRLSF